MAAVELPRSASLRYNLAGTLSRLPPPVTEATPMLAKVRSCALIGLEAQIVDVEVDVTSGLERMTLVGLPDAAVRESAERVRAALANSGYVFPKHRLTINLAPADLRKEGPAYDLPIAVGVLIASGQAADNMDDALLLGELSLDGGVRHVNGVLPMASMARRLGFRRVFVPTADANEAALVEGVTVYAIDSLAALMRHLNGLTPLEPVACNLSFAGTDDPHYPVDFADVKGQESVKRALEVACAGGHNALLKGSPGAGKTLLARALPSILPRLSLDEALEVTHIYSVADALPKEQPLLRARPFRAPHHTISHAGLVGGGRWPRPGEISLAHRGVLFLDELPEFGSKNLETLRQPLEDRLVTISRASGTLTFPASFMLVGAMNPCPCGYYGDPIKDCSCSAGMVYRYQQRISGPLLDRIDIHLDVPRVAYNDLVTLQKGEPSSAIRARVEAARSRQQARFAADARPNRSVNADMGPADVQEYCPLDASGRTLMKAAMQQMNLTARGYHRILKLARTIADLAGVESIAMSHLAEALQYRPKVVEG